MTSSVEHVLGLPDRFGHLSDDVGVNAAQLGSVLDRVDPTRQRLQELFQRSPYFRIELVMMVFIVS